MNLISTMLEFQLSIEIAGGLEAESFLFIWNPLESSRSSKTFFYFFRSPV